MPRKAAPSVRAKGPARLTAKIPGCKLHMDIWQEGDACMGFCTKLDANSGRCVCATSCKWCLRSFGQEDPLNPGLPLNRPGGRGLLCEHCRNTNHLEWRTEIAKDRAERLASYEKSMQKRIVFLDKVADWIEKHKPGLRRWKSLDTRF